MARKLKIWDSLLAIVAGNTGLADLWSALFSTIEMGRPAGELTPGPEPGTPFERLERWCSENDVTLVDYRDLKLWPRNKEYGPSSLYGSPKNKKRGSPYGTRSWEKCTCLMVHWTGTGAMAPGRGLGLPCHLYVTVWKGRRYIVLLHQFERKCGHGHSPANTFCAGLEVIGNGENRPGPELVELALRASVYWLESRERAVGVDADSYVCGHIMGHKSRGADPNLELTRGVIEPMIDDHHCKLGPVVGSGRPIRDSWWSPGRVVE